MKLKDGHTYITRTGLKRVVRRIDGEQAYFYPFESKGTLPGERFTHTENGRFLYDSKTKHDFVKEFKRAK